MEENGFLPIGKIVGTHGVKGTIKVYSYVESLDLFKPGGLVLIRNPKGLEKTYAIKWVKPHKRIILLSLEEIININLAETLIGSELFVEKAALPELEDGTYYWADIIGLSVFTTDEKYLGRVESIIATGSNDVYVVKDKDNEILIPAIESVVESIDLKQKTMRVDLPKGL